MQAKTTFLVRILGMGLMFAQFLSGCKSLSPTVPTHDVDLLYTQAASTMIAALEATRNAMVTQTSPVIKPPSETVTIMPAEVVNATEAPSAPTTPPAQPTSTPDIPTATTAAASEKGLSLTDSAAFVYLSPGLGARVQRNSAWDMLVNVKNTGQKTWDEGYYLGYHHGDAMGSPQDLQVMGTVKPGEAYTFTFKMTAPSETGEKKVTWVLRDDNEGDLLYIDFYMTVVN